MRRTVVMALLMLSCLALNSSPVQAGLSKSVAKATIAEFNTSYRAVRPDFLNFPSYTLKLDESNYACQIPSSLRRLGRAGETFRIRKIKMKRDQFWVELETPGKTRVVVRVLDQGKLGQEFLDRGSRQLLNDIFEFGPPPARGGFVGHKESHLLHLGRCNHQPVGDLRVDFDDHEAALAAGYRDCPICFESTAVLPYPNYLMHRAGGLQDARTFELVYPLSQDQELQDKLDELGAVVLSRWPLELSGFDYDFRVVVADQPLALSFRTGIVIVSDMMMKSADAEEELLFVLAHEIAHCELHLPPRSPYYSLADLSPLSKEFSGYQVWRANMQLAADLMAISWFTGAPDGKWDPARAAAALAKVQYANGGTDQFTSEGDQALALHQRRWLFEPNRFKVGDPRRVFQGIDGEGDVRYEVRYLGMLKDEEAQETYPYFLVTTTDYQDKRRNVANAGRKGKIRSANGHKAAFGADPYLANPGFSVLVIGATEFGGYFEKSGEGPVDVLEMWGLSGVKKWSLADGGGE